MSDIITASWLAKQLDGRHGLQTALATHLGIDRTKVNKMVKGRREISQSEALEIKSFFANHTDNPVEPDENEIRASIGNRLREARIAAGFSSAQSAALAFGIGATTYRHHENGTRGVKPAEAIRYAEIYGFSLDWLYMGKSELHAEGATSNLPNDAKRSIDAIVNEFDPRLTTLIMSPQERAILTEAVDIFIRLNGPDPKRAKDVETLSALPLKDA